MMVSTTIIFLFMLMFSRARAHVNCYFCAITYLTTPRTVKTITPLKSTSIAEIICLLERSRKNSGATICYTYFIFLIFFYYLLCKASDNFWQMFYRLHAMVLYGLLPFLQSQNVLCILRKYLFVSRVLLVFDCH